MSIPPPVNPADQFMEMAAAAVQFRKLFDTYVSVGFTEAQALRLLIAVMTNAMEAAR